MFSSLISMLLEHEAFYGFFKHYQTYFSSSKAFYT